MAVTSFVTDFILQCIICLFWLILWQADLMISYCNKSEALQAMHLMKWSYKLTGLTWEPTGRWTIIKHAPCPRGMAVLHCHIWTVPLTILQFLIHCQHIVCPSIIPAHHYKLHLISRQIQSNLHIVWLYHLNSVLEDSHFQSLHNSPWPLSNSNSAHCQILQHLLLVMRNLMLVLCLWKPSWRM